MSSALEKLNLRPQERRWLVGVLAVVFALLNVWLVWPHFKDRERVKGELKKAQDTLDKFNAEVAKLPGYKEKEKDLRGQGSDAPSGEANIALIKVAQEQVKQSGLIVARYNPGAGRGARNNEFFDETTLGLEYNTSGDTNLVDFLISITEANSMVRVRSLTVKPDSGGSKLAGVKIGRASCRERVYVLV